MQRLRLFVALDLPAAKKGLVDSWGNEALADPALRPVPEENLRITLLFLGNRPERQVPRLLSAMRDLCEGMSSPSLALRDPVQRPKGGRPRLYALPATSPSAEVLHIACGSCSPTVAFTSGTKHARSGLTSRLPGCAPSCGASDGE